jgi:hypothetical protein
MPVFFSILFQDVINELFHTERSHVRNLKVLDSVFRRPLIETGRMPRELVERIFPNLGDVLALHQRYNTAMKERIAAGGGFPIREIGDILTGMFLEGNGDTLVRIGGEFIKNQNSTIEELKRMRTRYNFFLMYKFTVLINFWINDIS